jgi:hypothetical protein
MNEVATAVPVLLGHLRLNPASPAANAPRRRAGFRPVAEQSRRARRGAGGVPPTRSSVPRRSESTARGPSAESVSMVRSAHSTSTALEAPGQPKLQLQWRLRRSRRCGWLGWRVSGAPESHPSARAEPKPDVIGTAAPRRCPSRLLVAGYSSWILAQVRLPGTERPPARARSPRFAHAHLPQDLPAQFVLLGVAAVGLHGHSRRTACR